ncbi:hypothetical protein FRB93_008571 [Tulasnella sp. JGI-2019a]|nr:hypothetical protein FRB93_008571 [Tulasnella sp. JGI-2019a]
MEDMVNHLQSVINRNNQRRYEDLITRIDVLAANGNENMKNADIESARDAARTALLVASAEPPRSYKDIDEAFASAEARLRICNPLEDPPRRETLARAWHDQPRIALNVAGPVIHLPATSNSLSTPRTLGMKSVIGEQSPYPVTASAASDVPVAPPVAPPAESADDSPISDLPSFVLDDKSALVPANVTAASSPSLPPPLNNDTSLGDSGAPILFDGQGGGTRHFQGAENTPEKTRDRRNKKTLARPSTQINPREKKVQKLQQPQVEHLNTALADLGQYHIPFERLEIDESSVIGRGGFGVVMRGKLSGYHSEVAIKRLRSDETRDIRVAKRLIREMKAWSGLEHPNILPLIGFYLSKGLDLALIVCPLQFHGNVKDYLQRVKPSILERLTLVGRLSPVLSVPLLITLS